MKRFTKKFLATALLVCTLGFGARDMLLVESTSVQYRDGSEDSNDVSMWTDEEIALIAETGGFSAGKLEAILNSGRCLGYMQHWKDIGEIPQDFYPNGTSSAPSAAAATTTTTSTVNANTNTATNNTTETQAASEKTVTVDDTVTGTYVTVETSRVYDSYKADELLTTLDAGTEVTVTGETSNGYYEISYESASAYTKVSNLAEQGAYEEAWTETESTDATCAEDGVKVYTNSLSGLTKEELVPAVGHSYALTEEMEATCTENGMAKYTCTLCGDTYTEDIEAKGHDEGEWKVTIEAGTFTEGEKVKVCTACGAILETETIPQTCPLPLAGVIGIAVGAVAIIGVGIAFVTKKKRTDKVNTEKES